MLEFFDRGVEVPPQRLRRAGERGIDRLDQIAAGEPAQAPSQSLDGEMILADLFGELRLARNSLAFDKTPLSPGPPLGVGFERRSFKDGPHGPGHASEAIATMSEKDRRGDVAGRQSFHSLGRRNTGLGDPTADDQPEDR